MTPDPASTTGNGSPLTTKEGWRAWTAAHPEPPAPPGDPDDSDALASYDQARLLYLSDPIVVRTPAVQALINNARRLLILNKRQISARRGLIITGAGGTGKTTAITQLGKAHELGVRRRDLDQSRIPVVYVTVPPAATPRMLAAEFARFLGLPVTSRLNMTDITNAVCSVLCRVGCDLVLVDEIHNLNLASRSGAEVSDQLKYFSEHIPATFVYAGVEVEQAGLFTGPRGRQIASRFAVLSTRPFGYGSKTERDNWRSLVLTFEQALPLRAHQPGSLARHSEFLYRRTGGMLGSLSHIIRGAAVEAILDSQEKITRAHLEAILLDYQAEKATSRPTRTRKPPRTGAA